MLEGNKLADAGEDKAYCRAIMQLDRLASSELPAEKLQCISQYFSLVSECYRSYHREEIPVSLSEQLLPVHTFCVVKTSTGNLYPTLKLLEQFVRRNDRLSSSMNMVSSLCLAAEFLCSWKV